MVVLMIRQAVAISCNIILYSLFGTGKKNVVYTCSFLYEEQNLQYECNECKTICPPCLLTLIGFWGTVNENSGADIEQNIGVDLFLT